LGRAEKLINLALPKGRAFFGREQTMLFVVKTADAEFFLVSAPDEESAREVVRGEVLSEAEFFSEYRGIAVLQTI
jgi:hypothetical protein